jgi:hypothetical protein
LFATARYLPAGQSLHASATVPKELLVFAAEPRCPSGQYLKVGLFGGQ